MGLEAHVLQGRSISAVINGQPFPQFSIQFDPVMSTLRFLFGEKARDHKENDESSAESASLPVPSVLLLFSDAQIQVYI